MQTNVLEPSIPDIYSDDGNQIGSEEIYMSILHFILL
jgi:hypothetical protein